MHPLTDDIYQTLCSVVGGNGNIRENVFTPYYHFIDFELWFDTNARTEYGLANSAGFLPISDTKTASLPQIRKVASGTNLPTEISWAITEASGNKIEKYAILIHHSDQYIINSDSQLSGETKNFIQQLETLKYKVISINPADWKGISSSSQGEKIIFLCRQLQISKCDNTNHTSTLHT